MSESKIMFLLSWSFYCHLCSSTITSLLSSAHNCQRWSGSCPTWLLWCRTPIPHSCPSPAECGLHSRYPKTQIPSLSYPGGWFWLPCEHKHRHTDIYKNETLFPHFFFLVITGNCFFFLFFFLIKYLARSASLCSTPGESEGCGGVGVGVPHAAEQNACQGRRVN